MSDELLALITKIAVTADPDDAPSDLLFVKKSDIDKLRELLILTQHRVTLSLKSTYSRRGNPSKSDIALVVFASSVEHAKLVAKDKLVADYFPDGTNIKGLEIEVVEVTHLA
jgi:hypothetical protein